MCGLFVIQFSLYLLSVVLSSVFLPGAFGTVFAAVCFLQEKFSCHVQVILRLSLLQFSWFLLVSLLRRKSSNVFLAFVGSFFPLVVQSCRQRF